MSALSFKLDAFEGPLDLLLHLISKHKLNIYDIEISLLLDQYMEYIDSIDEQDFDTAGDFLEMAARLIYIKTCSLLPQAQEAEEMKKELEGNLLEYSVCKEAAQNLRKICVYGDVFVRPPEKLPVNKTFTGNIDPRKLYEAYMGMTAKARSIKPIKAEQFSPIVATRIVTVTSKIVFVLKKLYKTGLCRMSDLYDGITDKSARVATFLAVLELTKSGRIFLNEDNTEITFNRESKRRHSKEKNVETTVGQTDISSDKSFEETDSGESVQPFDESFDVTETPEDNSEYQVNEISGEIFDSNEEPAPEMRENAGCMREKYAMESITRSNLSLLIIDKDKACDETSEECETVSDSFGGGSVLQESAPAEYSPEFTDSVLENVIRLVKPNRFSRRYRWRFPEYAVNCWTYGRERM